MTNPFTQADRLLSIETPLGPDVLLVSSFTGSEGISQLFNFDVNLLADRMMSLDGKVELDRLMGQAVTLGIVVNEDGDKRYINGIVRRFYKSGVSERFASYRAEVVPMMWLMALSADCRIFAHKTIPDVLEQMFKDCGIPFKMNLIGTYEPVDYCVQYRETALNFVCRLMEDVGINYWFDHTRNDHTLILSDANSGHKDTPDLDKLHLESSDGAADQSILEWTERAEVVIGPYRLKDLNFEMPRDTLRVDSGSNSDWPPASTLPYFDYPGGYAKQFNDTGKRLDKIKDAGEKMIGLRVEEGDATLVTIEAAGTVRGLIPGYKIDVDSNTQQDVSGDFIVTEVHHSVRQSPDYSGSDSGSGDYRNTFRCVPGATVIRPRRETPKPVVMGLQSGVVVDEQMSQSEEISPDKYGRVKVIFLWDSTGNDGAWLRVAQVRAGKTGGQIWIPRGGDDVLVAFMEGDPDQPVIVGSVYNAQNMPPYALPANKTQSGIKTRSSPEGAADHFNELRFEDKKDNEQIYMQAQKNLDVIVKVDETRAVGGERKVTVKKDESLHVEEGDARFGVLKGNWYRGVKKDMLTTVEEGDYELTIKEGHMLEVIEKGTWDLNVVKGDAGMQVGEGDFTMNIQKGSRQVAIDKGDDVLKVDGGDLKVTVTKGGATLKCSAGKTTIDAMQGIELKCGQNSIKIDQTGVKIEGMMVSINGKIQTEVKGVMTTIKGSAMLQAQGAITMIG